MIRNISMKLWFCSCCSKTMRLTAILVTQKNLWYPNKSTIRTSFCCKLLDISLSWDINYNLSLKSCLNRQARCFENSSRTLDILKQFSKHDKNYYFQCVHKCLWLDNFWQIVKFVKNILESRISKCISYLFHLTTPNLNPDHEF